MCRTTTIKGDSITECCWIWRGRENGNRSIHEMLNCTRIDGNDTIRVTFDEARVADGIPLGQKVCAWVNRIASAVNRSSTWD
jgi:hypothetical protein